MLLTAVVRALAIVLWAVVTVYGVADPADCP
jgi:hypothetical protein